MGRVVVTAGVLTLAVAAGCGHGSSVSLPPPPPDSVSATQINLQPSDLLGWQARPNAVTSPANARGEQALYACLGSPLPDVHTTANVNSAAFVGTYGQASSNVKLTHTVAQSEGDYSTLTKPGAADCARSVLVSTLPGVLPTGSTVASSSVKAVSVPAPPSDQATGSLVTVNVVEPGGRMSVYAQFTTILHDRALIAVQTIGVGQPFSASLQQSILSNVENRASQVGV